MQQGLKLSFLKTCADQTWPGGPPESCLYADAGRVSPADAETRFFADFGLSITPKGNALSQSLELGSLYDTTTS